MLEPSEWTFRSRFRMTALCWRTLVRLRGIYAETTRARTVRPSPATNSISTQLKTGEISAKIVAADTYSSKTPVLSLFWCPNRAWIHFFAPPSMIRVIWVTGLGTRRRRGEPSGRRRALGGLLGGGRRRGGGTEQILGPSRAAESSPESKECWRLHLA